MGVKLGAVVGVGEEVGAAVEVGVDAGGRWEVAGRYYNGSAVTVL